MAKSKKVGTHEMAAQPLITHDLQSALADVINGLELVDKASLSPDALMHVERAIASSHTLADLMDRLSNSLMGHDTDLATENRAFQFAPFIANIERRWTSRAKAKSVGFKISISDDLPEKIGLDRTSLDRILSNLIENGLKFCDDGDVLLDIGLSHDNDLLFVVRDQGPGFSKDAIKSLFEYKGRPENSPKKGSGLGLHIAKRLVNQMDGKIEVFNQQIGALVSFEIPASSWFVTHSKQLPQTLSSSLVGAKILLAEDNATSQMVLSKMLEGFGAILTVVDNGIDALAALSEHAFDLAVLDIEMPGILGTDVIMKVRKLDGVKADIPILVVSAYVMPGDREKTMLAGADHIVTKPIRDMIKFKLTLEETIAGRRGQNTLGATYQKAPTDTKMIDRSVFETLVSAVGRDNMTELIAKIQNDLKSVQTAMTDFIAKLATEGIRAQTHILVSVAGAVGALNLQATAEKLNHAANQNQHPEMKSLYVICDNQLTHLRAELATLAETEFGTPK